MKKRIFAKIKNVILLGFAAFFLTSTPSCIVVTSSGHRDHQRAEAERRREEERRREAERRRHERERERHGHHR